MGTGHRSPSRGILADEVLQYGAPELLLQVENVEGEADSVRHQARIEKVARGTTSPEALRILSDAVVELEREPDDTPPFTAKEESGDRAVHSAAHSDSNSLHPHHLPVIDPPGRHSGADTTGTGQAP